MVDEIDRAVVNALLQDGRASARDVATETGVAATTVSRRMDELEADGIIQEYTARVNYGALGYDVTAVFQLSVAGDGLADVTESLRGQPNLLAVYEVTGSHDIVAVGKFQDTDEMNAYIKRLVTDEHVRSVSTAIVLNAVREHEQFPVEESDQ